MCVYRKKFRSSETSFLLPPLSFFLSPFPLFPFSHLSFHFLFCPIFHFLSLIFLLSSVSFPLSFPTLFSLSSLSFYLVCHSSLTSSSQIYVWVFSLKLYTHICWLLFLPLIHSIIFITSPCLFLLLCHKNWVNAFYTLTIK
jgi:hypothetical protein